MSRFRTLLIGVFICLFTPALAQDTEADKGFLTELLQDSLGGEGRVVSITGFRGALSSTAQIDEITVADTTGVWLTLSDLTMKWNRSALLSGRVDIELLAARAIQLDRLPVAQDDGLPAAEAQPFSLPELPVSINLGALTAEQISLGAPVLGSPVVLQLNASAQLSGSTADVSLTAQRTDGQTGVFAITAGFKGTDQDLTLDIALQEGKDGIAARLLNLPDTPSVDMTIKGTGPLNDFQSDIQIATDGTERLGGHVRLTALAPEEGADVDPTTPPTRGFEADIKGDITALFAPQYRDFFGDSLQLRVVGQRDGDGTLDLSQLRLKTRELSLEGATTLNADYWPTKIDLTAVLDGEDAVLLPISGAETEVDRAALSVKYDREQGSDWTGQLSIRDLKRDGIEMGQLDLSAMGILRDDIGTLGQVTADLKLAADQFVFADPALAQAIGPSVSGALTLDYSEGKPLELTHMNLRTQTAHLTGKASIKSLDEAFETLLDARLVSDDLSKFSGLAARDLRGSMGVRLKGAVALGGTFDLDLQGELNDLAVDQTQADILLKGRTRFAAQAKRDGTGTQLKNAEIENNQVSLAANGRFATGNAQATYALRLTEFADFDPRLPGPATVNGTATLDAQGWRVDLDAAGPIGGKAEIAGLVTGPEANVTFKASVPDIKPLVPEYSGPLAVEGRAAQSPKGWRIATEIDGPYGLEATVSGLATGDSPMLTYVASLPDINPFVPKISGPLSATGTAAQVGDLWQVDTGLTGPGGMRARVQGSVSTSGDLNMTTNGSLPLEISDRFLRPRSLAGQANFDLAVRGKPALGSVSGTISAQDARLSAPELQLTLSDIAANVTLSQGRATVSVNGAVSSGGRVSVEGPVNLTGGMETDLRILLQSVSLADPKLYRTTIDGDLRISGPLSGGALIKGRIDLGETSITVPSTGASGFTILPDIVHQGASQSVRITQDRAGLLGGDDAGSESSGAVFGLDVSVSAPARIFVRGRGIDAELGGQLRLTGTTQNVISAGRFDLIRGRLDLLTKRFELDEGSVQMQGDLDPYIRFVASTTTTTGTASIIVEGLASSPEVLFESSPEAPQDEILANIFFGRDIGQLSPFQALQLVNAVRTLAGKGGESIVSRLRGGLGLDDLDIVTDEDGNTSGRAGKYISDNVYSDVTAGTAGASVSLNIDLTPSITARGSVSSTGESKLGVFFERDY